jgi:hypothetical protein
MTAVEGARGKSVFFRVHLLFIFCLLAVHLAFTLVWYDASAEFVHLMFTFCLPVVHVGVVCRERGNRSLSVFLPFTWRLLAVYLGGLVCS